MAGQTRRPLTARGVRAVLTRAGIDHSVLAITDDPQVWRDVQTGVTCTSVRIEGPADARRPTFHELLDRGLAVAPYPDCDYWSRPAGRRR